MTEKHETHQEMRYPNVWRRSMLLPLLCLTPPTDGFPWDDLRKILLGGQISRHSFSKLSGPTEL